MVAGTYCKSEPGAVTTGSFPAMLDYTDKSLALLEENETIAIAFRPGRYRSRF